MDVDHFYIAISETQDECTLNNRVWYTHDAATEWARTAGENSGCILKVIRIKAGTINELKGSG